MIPSVKPDLSFVVYDPSVSLQKRKRAAMEEMQTKKMRLWGEISVDSWGVIVSFLDRTNLLNVERVSRTHRELSEYAWKMIAAKEGMETTWPDTRVDKHDHSQKWGYFLARTFQRLLNQPVEPECFEHEAQASLILGRYFPISSCPIFLHTALNCASPKQKGAIKKEIIKVDYLANQADYKVHITRQIEHLTRLVHEQNAAVAYTSEIEKLRSLLKDFDESTIEGNSFNGISDEAMGMIARYIAYMQKIESKNCSDLFLQGFLLNQLGGCGEDYWIEAIGKGAQWILREKTWMDQLFSAFLKNKNELFLKLQSTVSARGKRDELIYIAEQLNSYFCLARDSAAEYDGRDAVKRFFKTLSPEQTIYFLFLACHGDWVDEDVKYSPIISSLLNDLKYTDLSSIEALSQLGELFIAFKVDSKKVEDIYHLIEEIYSKSKVISVQEAISMARFLWDVGKRSDAYCLYAQAIALYNRFCIKVDWEVCGDTPDKLFAIGELYRYLCRDQIINVGICSYKSHSQYAYYYLMAFEKGFSYSTLQLERIVDICHDFTSDSKALDFYIEPLRRLLTVEYVSCFSKQALIQILAIFEAIEDQISMEDDSFLVATVTNDQLHISVLDNPFSEEVVSAFKHERPEKYLILERELGSIESLSSNVFLEFLQGAAPAIRLCRERLANEFQGNE